MKPPEAKRIKKQFTEYGKIRTDNYFWLNQRNSKDVIEYLEAENSYTEKSLEHIKPLREKLYNEMISRIKKDDETVPYPDNGYFYFTRYQEGKEYPVYCRKKGSCSAEEEILLDVNVMAEGYDYFHAAGLAVSPDNKILAFGADTAGRRLYSVYFKELSTGKILNDIITRTTGSVVWAEDNKTVFYSAKDETLRPYKIFKHIVGTNTESDVEVYSEEDNTYGTYVIKTKSRKFILIGSYSTASTEFRFIRSGNPDDNFRVVEPREKGHEYYVDHSGDRFYILTNANAYNFKVMSVPVEKPGIENWKEIISHRPDVFIESIEVFKDFIALSCRELGLKRIKIINCGSKQEYNVPSEEETYTASISVNMEFDTDILRFNYCSLKTPYSTLELNMRTKKKKLLKTEEVLDNYNPENYSSERLFALADDGTKIPVSLVYKKGIKKDGMNPLLLNGYGSYGISSDPDFNSVRLSLLERGFVFAVAHIRGGQERGRKWYEEGKLLKKKNTFFDFIACAEYLIKNKYTDSSRLFAAGASAGGLLMGAAVNMRPELFKGIVAAVPFVDIISTMLDESVPLTTGEYDEWGNPDIKEYYDYMLSYSPYDNIEAKEYPAMLVTAGYNDSQVQYWEPAKWVAKLRSMKTDSNPLFLHTNMSAGHGGASGRFEKFKLLALEYAFILDQIGHYE